jgi:anti-sigma factor RsiW
MLCNEALRVQAWFDSELDAGASAVIEQHLAHCPECAALIRDLQSTRDAIRQETSYHRAPPALRAGVTQLLDRESPRRETHQSFARDRRFWWGALTGFVPAAAAAVMMFALFSPVSETVATDLLNAHLRSLLGNHLIDVASSDQHTVKPWFAGHADVSPPAADFAQAGYQLIGGRADFIGGHRSAVVVYRHGAHIINVFAWPYAGETPPDLTTRNGYHIACWRNADVAYCAVSDTAVDELLTLTRLLKQIKS